MKRSKNLILSLEILFAHKMRTGLSILGVVIGIAAVIVMVSAGKGTEKRILETIRNMGSNLIIVSAGQVKVIAGRKQQTIDTVTTLIPEDAREIADQCPSVDLATAVVNQSMTIGWYAEAAGTRVVGMSVEGFDIRNIATVAGRLFMPSENRGRWRVAVIGQTAKENLFGGSNPVGERILIDRVPFEIIGVMRPKGLDIDGHDQDDILIVPLETALRRLMNISFVHQIYVRAKTSDLMETAEKEIGEVLRRRHRLGERRDDFTIQNLVTLLSAEREIATDMTLLIGGVAGVSLLVGGVGILAVMLISVRERTNEIGLRRAVGAFRNDIRNQFLIESALLASGGGVAGIVLGIIVTYGISLLGYWPTLIYWPAVGAAFIFSVVIGLISGIYPAIRAASLEPIDALRGE